MLYTPNGSTRANHRCPHSHAPPSSTTAELSSHVLTHSSAAGLGLANSSHTNTNSPTAAGRYPQDSGYDSRGWARRSGVMRFNSRYTVRTGEMTRHTGPKSSEIATSPTHNN